MADHDRKNGFSEFAKAAEDYLGFTVGFRAAVIAAIQANDARVDELEEQIEALKQK